MSASSNEQWIQRFEAYLKRRFPDRSTAKHYVSDLRIFVQECCGPVTETTSQDVDTFVDQQRARGMAASTVKRRAASLKAFFDFVAEEMQEPNRTNPVVMRRHAGRQPRHLPRDLSDSEIERLLETVTNQRDLALISLMLYAGLRVGEVVNMQPEDITVPQDVQAPIQLRVMGKGRKERIAYLHREGYQPVARYLEEHPLESAQGKVFRNRFGKAISVAGVQERIRHYAQESGVDVTCHRLRHTYGRWMAESEMPVLVLSRLLGHASVQTTQVYIDGADPEVRRSYEAAMQRARTEQVPTAVVDAAPLEVDTGGPTTVVRQVPDTFDGSTWMPEWPDWLRDGCLAWAKQQWYQWKPSQRKRHVYARLYELRFFWRWRLAHKSISGWRDLTDIDIIAYVQAEQERGLATKTIKRTLDTLYYVLRYLMEQGQISDMPRRPQMSLPEPLPRHLKPKEVLMLESYVAHQEGQAQDADWLDIALYYLLAHAGLRLSEVLDLQVQDLDLSARRIRVRDGKGRRDRVVYLTRQAASSIGHYLQTVPHAAADLVLSNHSQPLSRSTAYRRLRHFCQAAGVEGVSAHRLRHTYATILLNNGTSIDCLRRLMGHENLNTTLIYARLADTSVERQYRASMEHLTNSRSNSL